MYVKQIIFETKVGVKKMKWEYKVVNINAHFKTGAGAEKAIQDQCSLLGQLEWELVNFQCYDMSTKFMLVFKRKTKE